MTRPGPNEGTAPARFGRLSVAIVAAILAGPPARSAGCGRCGGDSPEQAAALEPTIQVAPAPRTESGRNRLLHRHVWSEERPRRPTSKPISAVLGSSFVCVRSCDGGFFPVPYVGDRGSLAKICQALCPNAETHLYSMPFGGTIEDSVSISGLPYASLPNAGKFEQALDQNCSCRRKEQSWAEALADAEAKAQRHPGDVLVTPEISQRMAQPAAETKASVAAAGAADADLVMAEKTEPPTPVLDINGVDINLSAATAALSRATSGIEVDGTGGPAHYGLNQGQIVEQKGPDGMARRVRILAP
jgi:Protein of unknown function (DUF2865)